MTRWVLLLIALGLSTSTSADGPFSDVESSCAGGDREIRMLSRPEPYYPHSALMYCLSGEVRVQFTVDSSGRTRDLQVVDSEPAFIFNRAAIDAIERWRFSPACRDGRTADRSAVQTIMFNILPEARERCSEWQGSLDDPSLALVSELGARYALLAEHQRGQLDGKSLKAALDAPFPHFGGDLEQVADFHRQVLATWTPTSEASELGQSIQRLNQALQPDAIADDPGLGTARDRLDRVEGALDAWVESSQETYVDLAAAYRRVERATGLDATTLDQLVTPFAGDFTLGFGEWVAPHLETLERARAIVDYLDQNRSSWEATGQAIHFDREADARAWNSLWQDLIDHQNRYHSQYLAHLRTFEDYTAFETGDPDAAR